MILYGQRYNTQRRYYYEMEKLKKWTQINHYTILDLLTMKPHIIITEVLAQFTSLNTSASSALQFLNGLSLMLSLTFNIDLMNNHMLQFIRKAISAYMIVKPKYEDTQNTKLISLLMTFYSIRPAEIEGISLRLSVICEQTDKIDILLQPKTKSGLHSHKLPNTIDRTVCPRATFFDWLKRIDNKHGRSVRDNKYGALWWNEDITIPAKRCQISLRLKKLLDLMGHARNSKSTNEYYVFAERLQDNEKATKLFDTRGQVELGLLVIRGCTIIYNSFALVPPISLKLYRNASIQFFTLVPTLCGVCESITALYVSYTFFVTSPFNLREMSSCNIDKQVSELLTMVSNKLVSMRYQQSFMGGYAHAVR
ncbi:MAG: hypothetical protein EZS28_030257 [Streblomastix strix]|uniref:Tyr recombinase domain-containing protein n=1 Tax=Streblomastix strix TaxID=222440 RepID=A0A5J4UUX9_9EUKA|nr:MAG: hypothetical protein EZS28_030257 [Streblomastix strix]